MTIVSLITDFGLRDNFAGVMKAVILKINPRVRFVDICHGINPQDTLEGALALKSAYKFFPRSSIHLVVVDPGVGSKRKAVLVRTNNYFFVGPDNGVLSLALKEEKPIEIIEIGNEKYFLKPVSSTFHGRDIFAPVCAYISKGEAAAKFGRPRKALRTLDLPVVNKTRRQLCGEIIYVDRFGNLVSNIDKESLNILTGRKKLKVSIKNITIDGLSGGYFEGAALKPVALVDSFGYLEIAVNGDSASRILRAGKGEKVRVKIT